MIDRIPFVAKVALPIDPGSNATSKTESPRNVWTGGYFHAATDQLPCFAGLLFMQYTRNEEFVIRLVKRGDFEIDSEGRIWRVAQKIQYGGMKPVAKRRAERDRAGYLAVGGFIDGKRRDAAAHRLVWKHFYGEIPREMVINHKNGNKQDNRPSNLEVVTTAENNIHAFRVLHTRNGKGVNHSQHKIQDEDVRTIRNLRNRHGLRLKVIAGIFGVSEATVCVIAKGKHWSHVK